MCLLLFQATEREQCEETTTSPDILLSQPVSREAEQVERVQVNHDKLCKLKDETLVPLRRSNLRILSIFPRFKCLL